MPKVAETVDLGKLPAAEVITKHLSPIVMSQSLSGRRLHDGIRRARLDLPGGARDRCRYRASGAAFYQRQMHGGTVRNAPAAAAGTPSTSGRDAFAQIPTRHLTPEP